MADLSKTVAIIFQGQDNASGVSDKLADNLKSVGTAGSAATKQVDDLAKSTERLGDTEGSVVSLSNAMKALAASLVFKSFIDANIELERFELGMTQVTGSSQAAGKELEYVRGVADRLGLDVGEAGQAWLGLSAATKGSALEGEGARAIFEAISGQFKLLGRSSADVAGALVQVQQGISKGKFELEDLKSIAERMPRFFDAFAESLGRTTPELFKLISEGKIGAVEFLRFAESINAGIGSLRIEGFEADLARLRNEIKATFTELGQAGAFDALTKGLQVATAAIVGAVAYFKLLGETWGNVLGAIVSGDFSELGGSIDASLQKAAESTRKARDAMLGYKEATSQASNANAAASKDLDQMIAGMGRNADAQKIAEDATKKASESSKAAAKALADETKERQRAEEAAQKYALELEKLASNERIKFIEAKVSLDIANVQANAEKVIAAFDSINTSISSTGDVLGELFGLFNNLSSLDSSARNALFAQIDKENAAREKAFELQKALTEAQIENLRAQTRQIDKGDALIKIEGAGLQPHLEAFMWEILKAIQVRVNNDGLALLLGT
jgi:tape measure domain-containing protein